MCFTRVNAFNWFHVGAPTAVDANCGEPVALCMRVCVCERAYWTAKAHTAHIGLSLSRSQALCWCEWVARESATVCVRVYISLCVCVRAHTHYLPFWLWMPVRNTFHTLNLIRREEKWATLSHLCEWVSEWDCVGSAASVSECVCVRESEYVRLCACVSEWVLQRFIRFKILLQCLVSCSGLGHRRRRRRRLWLFGSFGSPLSMCVCVCVCAVCVRLFGVWLKI